MLPTYLYALSYVKMIIHWTGFFEENKESTIFDEKWNKKILTKHLALPRIALAIR